MSERVNKKTLSCDNCRRRKRQCDGLTPVCTSCKLSNLECTTSLDKRRRPMKNYVVALEARIAQLEKILKDAAISELIPLDVDAPRPDGDPRPGFSATTPTHSPVPTTRPNLIPSLTDDAADILKSVLDPATPGETSGELDLEMTGYETLLSLELEHKLLAQFWDWQRMHHPYVAPVPFLLAYAVLSELVHPDEPIPDPPPPPPSWCAATALNAPLASAVQRTPDLKQYISPLLLYAMFAIAALFHGDAETSEVFYARAKAIMFVEAANPRVATVQAFCLMATWEMGYARSPAAWTLGGVAMSLCIRLGMNIDATPLVQSGAMPRRLFETRNFVFWAAFHSERFKATCMGMRSFFDRQIISTPTHSTTDSLGLMEPTGNPGDPTQDTYSTWWSPYTLGMGDVLRQASWDVLKDLAQMIDDLFDSVYASDASTRTPQEILELVARNHLTIQKFIDNLPRWLRSTGILRRKESGLVYIHLLIHLASILTNRPFLSSHHPPSSITRKYRTLAFRTARASALQVSCLIRHIPLSSPCVTIPYVVYSACTILLLAPEDPAAMDGVRTGLACLDQMDESGYWVNSANDAARRIRALAERWGVGLASSRRVFGLAGGEKSQGRPLRATTPEATEPSPLFSTGLLVGAGSGTLHIRGDTPKTSQADPHSSTTGSWDAADGFAVPGYGDSLSNQSSHSGGSVLDFQGHPTHLPYQQPGIPGFDSISVPFQSLGHDSIQYQHLQDTHQPTSYHSHDHHLNRRPLPHVAYASSHADPQHDMHIPHTHWHTIIPTHDSALFPPDPNECADMGQCFSYTAEQEFDPAFVDRGGNPYAGVTMDWIQGIGSGFLRFGDGTSAFGGLEEQISLQTGYGYSGGQTELDL